MNGTIPSVGNLSIGYRALAVLVAGIQFLAVGVLLFEVLLDVNFPGLRSFTESFGVSALLLLAAYLCGLAVDGTATKVWNFIVREGPFAFQRGGDSNGKAEYWLEVRTDLDRYPQLQNLGTWLVAQQWWWRSRQAAAEAGDLRLRLMLGKDSAANAALAWGLCVIALVVVPLRAGSDVATQPPVWGLAGAALMTGCVLGWSLGSTLIRPEIERPVCRLKRWWVSGVIALVTLGLWGGLRVAEADLPEELWWIALGAAFGPAVIFAFVYVRLDSNALYHRLVRDAFLLGEPGPTELEAE